METKAPIRRITNPLDTSPARPGGLDPVVSSTHWIGEGRCFGPLHLDRMTVAGAKGLLPGGTCQTVKILARHLMFELVGVQTRYGGPGSNHVLSSRPSGVWQEDSICTPVSAVKLCFFLHIMVAIGESS